MEQKVNIQGLDEKIKLIKKSAEELKMMADAFPALYRNSDRILASIKMLEINISDLLDA